MKNLLLNTGLIISLAASLLTAHTHAAHHGEHTWKLSAENSKVSYTSIKKNSVGENNHFKKIDGYIDGSGNVLVNIDVTSVETFIGIRNQRTVKHVFDIAAPTATLKSNIDLQKIEALEIGKTTVIDTSGTLTLSGKSTEIEASMFVARLSDNRFLASTNDMIMVKTADLGVDEGVNKLMELAKLSSITRVVPVSLRMVFNRQGSAPAKVAASSANVAATADAGIKAGKKLYRQQCQACHQAKKEANGVGPHLVALNDRKVGSVSGFNYSDAVKNSGITWDAKTLSAFLADPQKSIPGNNMPFGGIKNPNDVQNLVAYLLSL